MNKIAVMGAGTWGTTLALLLNKNGHKVTLWSYKEKKANNLKLTRKHSNMDDVIISEEIEITSDIGQAIYEKEIIIVSVPSKFMRESIKKFEPYIKNTQIIVNTSKGIEDESLKTMTQVIKEILPENEIATLSGPSHAEEVVQEIATTCIVASKNPEIAHMLQNVFMANTFRVYRNSDILGVELGGALKNIIALASGIADGLELGDNSKAALITRGLTELMRVGVNMGADMKTFYGLSGLGDLIVTCSSMHSRNRRCGILIGKGYKLEDAICEIDMVVEGVSTAKSGYLLAKKYNANTPILEAVYNVLFCGKNPKEIVEELMCRDKCDEFVDI